MHKQALIRAILLQADHETRATAEHVVDPLRRFGHVWFDGGLGPEGSQPEGHWWFSEQVAEISTYTAEGHARNFFGAGEFDVKQEEALRATYHWEPYGERGEL